tara:strand:- start:1434 stop:1904 length:471 start_codon:yes stop_codon:yes gene_type:complete
MSGEINKGRKLFICETAQADDLTQTEYEALTWVEVANVVTIGETGSNVNVVSQDYHGTTVTQKRAGINNAGDPTVEVGYTPADVGQIALNGVANNGDYYASKMEMDDNPGGTSDTIKYNRGLVLGPVHTNGGVEDWDNRTYTLGLVQLQIAVAPVA